MTLLAMLRHAETAWTQEGRIQGRSDVPLSPEGKAELLTRAFPAQWRAAKVVSSPLKRCLETGSLLGLTQIASDSRLAEMSWGQWEGGRLADLRSQLGEAMLANEARGLDFMPPGGESPRMVFERARSLLAEIAAAGNPTLAIAHRGVIRAIFAQASGWDMRGRAPTKLDWKCLHVFRLSQDGMPAVHRLNVHMDASNSSAAAT
jgi:broad specificity phosphatase PhoE